MQIPIIYVESKIEVDISMDTAREVQGDALAPSWI